MADSVDMILPMLREMRAENVELHEQTRVMIAALDKRLGAVEGAQVSYRQALSADTLMSRLLTGEFEERIEQLEKRVASMEARS